MSIEAQFLDFSATLKRTADNQTTLGQIKQMLASNIQKEQALMSQITDWAAAEQVNLSAIAGTLTNIETGVVALDALITQFQDSPGTLSTEDQAALDGIQSASKTLVTQASAISTAPPVATTAAPGSPAAPLVK